MFARSCKHPITPRLFFLEDSARRREQSLLEVGEDPIPAYRTDKETSRQAMPVMRTIRTTA